MVAVSRHQTRIFFEEVWFIFCLGAPTMIRCWLLCTADRATLGFVGHYDPSRAHIASAAFGKMYSNVTGMSIGIGLALGISTFCSQNHGRGAGEENGVAFRQCLRMFVPAFFVSLAAAVLAKPLFSHLGQPTELLTPVQQFSTIQVLGLVPIWLSEALNNVLASQCLVIPGMWCDIAGAVVNLALAYALLRNGSGFLGSAWASVVSSWVSMMLIVSYILHRRLQPTVWKVPREVSSMGQVSLKSYARATLPSAFSLWSEWWAAEILAVLAGLLPGKEASVGANGILSSVLVIFYMTYVGLQRSVTTRVGNLVGAQDAARIPMAILGGVFLALVLSCASSVLLQVFGHQLLRLWTSEPGILAEAESANLGIVLSVPPYAVMMCLLGVLRGAGLQMRGAVTVFISFYIFGLPIGAYLGLSAGYGLMGIWMGNVIGLSLSSLIMGIMVCFISWEKVVSDDLQQAQLQEGSISLSGTLVAEMS
ncbi:unnamed protein product [Polarella glacialis]|uniref:Protein DETOXIFICATION n=1 Tax=Polarella glacialis TaxID=89957 RepID=A0A813JMC9_POLGL|nr:unnamed protein product [Polarella glacialis]